MIDVPDAVVVREVGLRDGLQILARTVPTSHKRAWLRGAHAAGLRHFEVASFVPPRLMPQMADAAEVVAASLELPGAVVSVLVPNLRGAERALASGPHAPGASGNVATEDVAHLFASMGVPTGLDLTELLRLRGDLAHWLPGEPLHGAIASAGLPKTLAAEAVA